MIKEHILTGGDGRHCRVSSLACDDDGGCGGAWNATRDPETGPGPEHRHRGLRHSLAASDAKQISGCQMRQRSCNGLKIIAEMNVREAEGPAQLVRVNRPGTVRQHA